MLRGLWPKRGRTNGKRRPTSARTIDPARLTSREKDRLVKQLYPVYSSMFGFGDEAFFRTHLLFPECDYSRMTLLYGDDGREVGYTNGWLRYVNTAGGRIAVVRGTVFADLAYRSSEYTLLTLVRVALHHLARHPLMPCYGYGLGVHAASYCIVAKTGGIIYPNRHHTPASVTELATELASHFGYDTMPGTPWVTRFGTQATDPRRMRRSEFLSDDPDAQFFWRQVDPYGPDAVLLQLVPMTFRNIGIGVSHALRNLVRHS